MKKEIKSLEELICVESMKVLDKLGAKEEFLLEVKKMIDKADTKEVDRLALGFLDKEEVDELKLKAYLNTRAILVLRNGDIRRFILSSFPFITSNMGPAYWDMMTHNFMLNHTIELSYE